MKDASFLWGDKVETENLPISPTVFFFLTYAFSSYTFLHNFCCTSYEVSVQFNSVAQSCPALFFPSIRVFSNESALHIRWPKCWSFSPKISPTNEHPRLISFRIDWLDLLAVQGTLKSLLQHHSSKASILLVLSFLYTPTLTSIHDHWKNHSLD